MISLAITIPFTLPQALWPLCCSKNVPGMHLLQSSYLLLPLHDFLQIFTSSFIFSGHCLKITFLIRPSLCFPLPTSTYIFIHSCLLLALPSPLFLLYFTPQHISPSNTLYILLTLSVFPDKNVSSIKAGIHQFCSLLYAEHLEQFLA